MAFRPGVPHWNRPAGITGAEALFAGDAPIAALKGRSSTGFFHGIIRGRFSLGAFPQRIKRIYFVGAESARLEVVPFPVLSVAFPAFLGTRYPDLLARVFYYASADA
jgi:hypothetical protein